MCRSQRALRTLAGLALLAAGWCNAAEPRPGATPARAASAVAPVASAPALTKCPDPRDLANVRVDGVSRVGVVGNAASSPPVAELRNEIEVHVSGLEVLSERAKCTAGRRSIVLFLDGRPVPTATPYPPVDPESKALRFQLERKEESRSVWTHLLGRPAFDERLVPVSVGLIDEYAVASDEKIKLRVIPKGWFWAWTIILVLLIASFIALAIKSDVIRDTGASTGASRKPYSLAKMQAAWWFFLVLAAYLFIGLITGDYNTSITGTVLSLMGISAATAVGSALIDAGKPAASDPATTATPSAQIPGNSAQVVAPPLPLLPTKPVTRGRWWLDIVSDENGVNFHRFQMAAWTAVLGIIFVHDVWVGLAMPDFDNTLLGLLGISSGTYLGLKVASEK